MRSESKHTIRLMVTAIIVMVMVAGCRTSKPQKSVEVIPPIQDQPMEMSYGEVFDKIVEGYNDYDCFSTSFKLTIVSPQSISFSGRAYIERNKSIYLSLRKFGMEVARLYLTNDSIVAVDRFNKRYVAESLGELTANFELTIGNIQNLLTGQVFVPGNERACATDFDIDRESENGQWIAIPKEVKGGFEAGYVFSAATNRLMALAVKGGETVFLTRYTDYYPTTGGEMAGDVNMRLIGAKVPLEITVGWTWSGSVWNRQAEMKKFVYPDSNYQRIAASDLLKILQ